MIQCAEPGWRDALERFGAFDLDEFSDGEHRDHRVLRRLLLPQRVGHPDPRRAHAGPHPGADGLLALGRDGRASRRTSRWRATTTRRRPTRSRPPSGGSSRRPSSPTSRPTSCKMADLRASRPDFDAMSDAELVAWFRGHAPELRRLFAEHLYITVLLHGAARRDPGRVHRDRRPHAGDDARRRASAASTRRRRRTRSGSMGRQVRASASLTAAFDAGVDGLLERLRAADDADVDAFLEGVRRLHLRVRLARPQRVGDERAVVGDRPRAAAGRHRPDAARRRRPGPAAPPGGDGRRPRGRHPRRARRRRGRPGDARPARAPRWPPRRCSSPAASAPRPTSSGW